MRSKAAPELISRAMQFLASRLATGINMIARRTGTVFASRFFSRPLAHADRLPSAGSEPPTCPDGSDEAWGLAILSWADAIGAAIAAALACAIAGRAGHG